MGMERIVAAGAVEAPWRWRLRRRRRGLIAVLALLASAPAPGSAQDVPAEAVQEEMATLQARMASLQGELERLASERASVVNSFETADVELALRRQQLAILEQRNGVLTEERAELEIEVERLEATFVESRRGLRARVGSLYRIGPLSYSRMLLAAETASDALIAYQIMTYLAARDRDLLRTVRSTVLELDETREALAETERQLAEVAADTEATATALSRQQEERRALLAGIDREAETQRAALAAAQRSAGRLSSTMLALSRAAVASAPAAFASARGRLQWPVIGAVVGEFGRRRHPIYDTYTVSRGIEIEGAPGDPVAAVFDGRVVFADWYGGYGLMVIVDHGGGYFSLYGHLSVIGVRVNQPVGVGDIVGQVGDTASLIGPNLYFEVREQTDALNPLNWLQRR
ncbi:MAG TPA: peptidoglycan DD-metalloendopeptidase family protein [Acidobacteriota bacterium]|nr:peptidoglycan DD-metalloendopeptidase family protein [Acidobacteriota bacterium]